MATCVWAIISLPILLFLPGYLIVNYFADSQRAEGGLTAIEAVVLSILLSSALTGITGVVLAQAGYFRLLLLVTVLALISLCVALVTRLERRSLNWHVVPSSKVDWLIMVAVLIGAGVLFLQPHECVLGGADAGVYVNLGVNIAKTGGLLIHEPLLTDIEPDLLPGLLREQPAGTTTRFIRLPGFYVSDRVPGLVIPQFYPLHPVWLGIGYRLFDISGALLVTPAWAVLSVVVIFLYARSLFSRQIGGLTGSLLMIVPLQIYFARYPTAEPLTQYLSWAGLWAFDAFDQGRSPGRLWGLAAGLALGQSFLARIDTLPLLIVPAGWILFRLLQRRGYVGARWFLLPLVCLLGFAGYHGLAFSRPYTLDLLGGTLPFLLRAMWPALVGLGVAAGILGLVFRYRARWGWLGRALSKRILRHGVALLLIGAAIYAYFVRPRIGHTAFAEYWYADSRIPVSNHENLVRLGWYLSPLGIGLAVFGGVLVILNERWAEVWPLWGTGGVFTVLYLYNILNNPFQIYAMRRYVPVVVPFCILLAAYGISWIWRRLPWRRAGMVVSTIVLVTLVGWLAYNGRLIWGHVDQEGAARQIEQVADSFEGNSIALFVDPAPVGLGAVLGTPLQFLHGITSFDLQEDALDMSSLKVQVSRWLEKGYGLYVVKEPDASDLFPSDCLVPIRTARLDVPRLERSYDHAPSLIEQVHYRAEIYQVTSTCSSKGE